MQGTTAKPPRKPEPYECCGSGCDPCIMDIYEEALREFQATQHHEPLVLGDGSKAPVISLKQ